MDDYGQIAIGGSAVLGGAFGVACDGGYAPAISNSFPLITYTVETGTFAVSNLPPGATWQEDYGAMAFSVEVTDINQLTFAVQPAGTNATETMAPVVVQVMDAATHLPVGQSGVPITITWGRRPQLVERHVHAAHRRHRPRDFQ